MKYIYALMAGALLATGVAAAAQAMVKVTNLSDYPQTVVFSNSGSDTSKTVGPNDTAYFSGPDGMLSLATPQGQKIKNKDQGTIGMSGMGMGFVGAVRTSEIPASPFDEFVVWPDGRLMLQKRRSAGFGGSCC